MPRSLSTLTAVIWGVKSTSIRRSADRLVVAKHIFDNSKKRGNFLVWTFGLNLKNYNFRSSVCSAIWRQRCSGKHFSWEEISLSKLQSLFCFTPETFSDIFHGWGGKMFCPPNETIQQLTEKTKLLAQKCTQQIRVTSMDQSDSTTCDAPGRQQVATFKSYIKEDDGAEPEAIDFPPDSRSPANYLTVNLSSLNRIIKNGCSFVSTTSYTFPRKKPKVATAKWFIKVSL